MSSIVRIVIVDDHEIFRTGLRMILDGISDFKVVGEAGNSTQLIDLLKKNDADVIFMDIQMPGIDGIQLTKNVKEKYPEIAIIGLTMFGDIEYFNKMIEAGADGFLLKKASPKELKEAIFSVVEGFQFVSKEFALNTGNDEQKKRNLKIKLSQREIEILEFICKGLSTSEIAEKLFLSNYTVDGHRQNIMRKIGAKNTASLVSFAIKNNLVEI